MKKRSPLNAVNLYIDTQIYGCEREKKIVELHLNFKSVTTRIPIFIRKIIVQPAVGQLPHNNYTKP